jgi:GH35 family endo-1,4-beta-xylanase
MRLLYASAMRRSDWSRRSFLAVPAAALFTGRVRSSAAAAALMKDAYRNVFVIGTALDFRRPDEFDATELDLITSQFNALTPENSMKPGPVHPQEATWNWTVPDALMDFCTERGMKAYGHTLVWHQQTSPWFFEGADRQLALARLRDHILTTVGRYKGRIVGWDVVNEAINDGGDATTGATENLRSSGWLKSVGPDFLIQAFRFAREADPTVALHYNDYNIESGFKHQSSLVLLKRLIGDGAPITTVGIQGHWSVTGLTPEKFDQIEQAILNYKALKLKVAITELDVTLTGAGGGQFGGGRGRGTPPPPPTAEALQAQADTYGRLFAIFVRHRDVIDRVTFWGLHDRRSWRSGLSPLAFDREGRPKPALDAIIAAAPKT